MTANLPNPAPVFWNQKIKAKIPVKAIIAALFAIASALNSYAVVLKWEMSDLVMKY